MKGLPNKPDAVNPAIALQWRRVTDLKRLGGDHAH
jgi:hypothetical protein